MINLHISYLPYNKGAHPNFWSWVKNTPKGVSIHLISEKIDAGDIIFQKKLIFQMIILLLENHTIFLELN